jgi:hypothetical protein
MPEDANNPNDEDRAEHVLSDIDSQRLKTIRETNEKAFKEGNRFSMSRMQTLDQSFSKFEITGLDDDKKSSQTPAPKSEFVDPAEYLRETPEPGSLSVADKAIRAAFTALPEPNQNAIKKAFDKVDSKSAQYYLKADWDNICGDDKKVELGDLIEAFAEDGLSGADRANLFFLMVNYDKVKTDKESQG